MTNLFTFKVYEGMLTFIMNDASFAICSGGLRNRSQRYRSGLASAWAAHRVFSLVSHAVAAAAKDAWSSDMKDSERLLDWPAQPAGRPGHERPFDHWRSPPIINQRTTVKAFNKGRPCLPDGHRASPPGAKA